MGVKLIYFFDYMTPGGIHTNVIIIAYMRDTNWHWLILWVRCLISSLCQSKCFYILKLQLK